MAGYVFRPSYRDKDTGEKKHTNVWWIGYSVAGKKYRESAKTESKREAEALLARRLAARGQAPAERLAEQTTFDDLAELVINDYKRNGRKSLDRLELSIQYLKEFFEGHSAAAIDEAAVEKYVTKRLKDESPKTGEPYSAATVNRELAALKRMLHLGYKMRLVARVPVIETLKEDNARKGFFTEKDVQALLAAARPELKALIETAYITGWRKQELLSRDWRHVDFENGWLRLEPGETKNGEGRQFPLTARLRSVLEAQSSARDRLQRDRGSIISPVFFRFDGPYEGRRIRNFFKEWRKLLADCGQEERIFHDFRRTAVRNLIRAGIGDKVAMKLTGHKTREVFDRYNIVDEPVLKEAAARLDAVNH